MKTFRRASDDYWPAMGQQTRPSTAPRKLNNALPLLLVQPLDSEPEKLYEAGFCFPFEKTME